jgi:transitional endoplasmic reticulum ATPase
MNLGWFQYQLPRCRRSQVGCERVQGVPNQQLTVGISPHFERESPINMPPVKKVHTAEVVRHGEALMVPPTLALADAIDILTRLLQYEDMVINVSEPIQAFPWDGAQALAKALEIKFGYSLQAPTPGFFGDNPPELRAVTIDHKGRTLNVPWGRFKLPNVDGWIATGAKYNDNGMLVFVLHGQIKRKHEHVIQSLAALTREVLDKDSIYKGRAISIRFRDEDGEKLDPNFITPKFVSLESIDKDNLIFSKDLQTQIEHNVFGVIQYPSDEDKKYGVLLEGPPGTGKSLCMAVAAKLAVQRNRTVVYVENIDDFEDAVKFSQLYAGHEGSLVILEDIDRVVNSGDRTKAIDRVLNIMDGIDTKSSRLMVIMTSNHADNIQQPMMRPGRIDYSVHIPAPDAQAVEKLIRLYGKDTVDKSADLTEVGTALAGRIPAVIMEVVKRANRSLRYRNGAEGKHDKFLTTDDLLVSAGSMTRQLAMLNRPVKRKLTDVEKVAESIAKVAQAMSPVGVSQTPSEATEVAVN